MDSITGPATIAVALATGFLAIATAWLSYISSMQRRDAVIQHRESMMPVLSMRVRWPRPDDARRQYDTSTCRRITIKNVGGGPALQLVLSVVGRDKYLLRVLPNGRPQLILHLEPLAAGEQNVGIVELQNVVLGADTGSVRFRLEYRSIFGRIGYVESNFGEVKDVVMCAPDSKPVRLCDEAS